QRIVLGDDHALNVHVTVEGDVVGGLDVEHALDVHARVELGIGVGRDANVHQVGAAAVDVGGIGLEGVGVDGGEFRCIDAFMNMGLDQGRIGGAADTGAAADRDRAGAGHADVAADFLAVDGHRVGAGGRRQDASLGRVGGAANSRGA